MTEFFFVRSVDASTWPAFFRSYKEGERVFEFTGHDYGCSRDDAAAGFETITCSEVPNQFPFFTVPVGLLRYSSGNTPNGDYVNPKKPLKKLPD